MGANLTASEATIVESRPPDNKTPQGTSPINLLETACVINSTMSPFGLSQSNSILYGIRHCENIGSSPTLNDAMCPGGTICTGSFSGMAASKDANVMPLPCDQYSGVTPMASRATMILFVSRLYATKEKIPSSLLTQSVPYLASNFGTIKQSVSFFFALEL